MKPDSPRDEKHRVTGGFLCPPCASLPKEARPKKPRGWTLGVSSGSGKRLALSKSGGAGQSDVPGDVDAQTSNERMIGRLRRSTTSYRRLNTTSDDLPVSMTPLEDAVCGRLGCRKSDGVAIVDPGDGYPRALCRRCRVAYLEVVV